MARSLSTTKQLKLLPVLLYKAIQSHQSHSPLLVSCVGRMKVAIHKCAVNSAHFHAFLFGRIGGPSTENVVN